ncbi:caspase family protein [Acidimangrovimonas sediminis]|uniref:caspase family protein n=1 Tax=Acidimangrovimonas sediminis TaxID=2056283 RepID=UPI000C808D92|nr:caspase family protein [Acidimangrovimonas sediminis]
MADGRPASRPFRAPRPAPARLTGGAGLRALGTAAGVALGLALLPQALAAKPMALVIGEAGYKDLPALKAPAADAWSMGELMKSMGYEVTSYGDLDAAQMALALERFKAASDGAEALVVYFSGHGARVGGKSWLLPVDAGKGKALARGLTVSGIARALGKPGRPLMVLVDAGQGPAPDGAAGPGLARSALPEGLPVIVVTAAAADKAAVTPRGAYSPFTLSLLTYLPMPGQPVATVLRWIGRDTAAATAGRQTPQVTGALPAGFSLVPAPPAATPKPAPAPAAGAGPLLMLAPPQAEAPQTKTSETKAPETTAADTKAADTKAPEAPAPDAGVALSGPAPTAPGADSAPHMGAQQGNDTQVAALAPGPKLSAPRKDAAPKADAAPPPDYSQLPALAQNSAPASSTPASPDGVHLAALPAPPPAAPATPDTLAPQGTQVLPDGTRVPLLEGDALDRAIQTELKRVNCYLGAIDGDFGPGSRGALADFLKSRNLPADNLDPTPEILGQLMSTDGQVCETKVSAPARNTAPARTSTPTRSVSTPKPAPAAPADSGGRRIKRKGGLMPSF